MYRNGHHLRFYYNICFIVRSSVRIGEFDLSKTIDYDDIGYGKRKYNEPVQDLEIEEIIPYPGYDPESFANDIGLLRVAKMNLSIGKFNSLIHSIKIIIYMEFLIA